MKINNLEVYGVIYKVTNKTNNKSYIGATTIGFDKRYKNNFFKYTSNKYIKKDIDNLGKNNFTVNKIIDVAFSEKELYIKEKTYIQLYKTYLPQYGYNMTTGGKKTECSEMLKKKFKEVFNAEDFRKKESESHKKLWENEIYRGNVINSMKNYWSKEESKEKRSISTKNSYTNELREVRRIQKHKMWSDDKQRKKVIDNMKKVYILENIETNDKKEFLGRKSIAEYLGKSEATIKKYLINGITKDNKYKIYRKCD